MEENRNADLTPLYQVYSHMQDGNKELHSSKRHSVAGLSSIRKRPGLRLQDLLDFKDKIHNVVNSCFDNNKFMSSFRDVFEFFTNLRSLKTAELITKYEGMKLRAGSGGTGEYSGQIMLLFRFTNGKEVLA